MTLRSTWRNGVILLLFLLGPPLFLTACEATTPTTNANASPGTTNVRVEPDVSSSAKNISIDPLLPPGGTVRPAQIGETGRERSPEGLPLLQPKGLKAEDLFREPVKDTDQRLKRLENAVTEIRRDLDAALPAINRLVAIEGDIQELIQQLQTITGDGGGSGLPTIAPPPPPDGLVNDLNATGQTIEPLAPEDLGVAIEPMQSPLPTPQTFEAANPVPVASPALAPVAIAPPLPTAPVVLPATPAAKTPIKPAAKPTPPPKAEKHVSAAPKSLAVDAVRVGDHPDKTRIVIDSATPITMNADLDLQEKVLILDVQGAHAASGTKKIADSKMVRSFNIKPSGAGAAQAVFELSGQTKILRSSVMPPTPENPHYRAIIDLAPVGSGPLEGATP